MDNIYLNLYIWHLCLLPQMTKARVLHGNQC
jgi:hypothetical protein